MIEVHYHTIAHLAKAADLSAKTLRKRVRALLSDPDIARTFGSYPRWTLPLYQQRILIDNIPELFHLRTSLED